MVGVGNNRILRVWTELEPNLGTEREREPNLGTEPKYFGS